MTDFNGMPAFQLIYVVVNHGMGSKILHKAKEYGISGGTIVLGKGTISNAILNFLSLYDERKEIVLMASDNFTANDVLRKLNKHFHFEKPNHGIVFSTCTCAIVGSRCIKCEETETRRGATETMYQLIIAIVNRGMAEDAVEAAEAAGSKGGTIINARGSGIHETSKIFNMDIEPEKEIVMIISRADGTSTIVSSIREKLEIDKPGSGIVFVQDVKEAYGIYE